MKTTIFAAVLAIFLAGSILFAQPRNGGMKPPTLEDRLKMVDDKIFKLLELNNIQKEKVVSAFKDFFDEMDKLMELDAKPPMPDKAKVEPLEKVRDEKVKQVISGTLFSKYLELEKAARPKRPDEGRPQKETSN